MSTFRPQFEQQGPATNCVINGKAVGWLSCTSYAMAMLIDRATLGLKQPSGCAVRRGTGDTTGGLTMNQVSLVAEGTYKVDIEVHVGANVCTPKYAAAQLAKGRPVVLQGNTGPLVGGRHKSTNGGVNHAVLLNEGRGWDGGIPDEVLVYDPAADGRRQDIDQGPSWWSWSEVLKFAAALRPWGEADPRRLGSGKWYCGIGPDTEPHVVLRYGGKRTKPFPDRTRAIAPSGREVNVHSRPSKSADTIVDTIADGDLFVAYQTASGDEFRGSRTWYGSQDGREWVHAKRLAHKGGST